MGSDAKSPRKVFMGSPPPGRDENRSPPFLLRLGNFLGEIARSERPCGHFVALAAVLLHVPLWQPPDPPGRIVVRGRDRSGFSGG